SGDMTYVSNVRHIELLRKAKEALADAMNSLEMGMPLDIVQIDVRRAWEYLGEIIGDTASDSLIDQLFSQFCLGKQMQRKDETKWYTMQATTMSLLSV